MCAVFQLGFCEVSCIDMSFVSHSFMRSSKGLTKGELRIAWELGGQEGVGARVGVMTREG